MQTFVSEVDSLGALRAHIKLLKDEEATLESKIKAKIGKDQVAEGVFFKAVFVVAFRETLIADKVRQFLHANQLRAATRVTEVKSLKVTAKEKV